MPEAAQPSPCPAPSCGAHDTLCQELSEGWEAGAAKADHPASQVGVLKALPSAEEVCGKEGHVLAKSAVEELHCQ